MSKELASFECFTDMNPTERNTTPATSDTVPKGSAASSCSMFRILENVFILLWRWFLRSSASLKPMDKEISRGKDSCKHSGLLLKVDLKLRNQGAERKRNLRAHQVTVDVTSPSRLSTSSSRDEPDII